MTAATATRARRSTRNARPAWMDEPATASQVATLRKHAPRKVLPAGMAAELAAKLADGSMTKGDAKLFLDILFDASTPWKPRPAAANPVTEAGMYRNAAGEVYRVQAGRQGERRLYAKLLVITELDAEETDGEGPRFTARFDYANGAIYRLTADDRMTTEQARAIGHDFRICCQCAAVLTDPASIDAGIGPVCAGKI